MNIEKEFDPRYKFIVDLVSVAGEKLLDSKIEYINNKNNNPQDLVSNVDMEINNFLVEEIKKAFPDANIISEEDKETLDFSVGTFWSLDPIDGTSNFVRDIPHFAICISIIENNVPIIGSGYNPKTRELFSFEKGMGAYFGKEKITPKENIPLKKSVIMFNDGRTKEAADWFFQALAKLHPNIKSLKMFGCSGLDLTYVGVGRTDALIYPQLSSADIAFAIGFVRELGGVIRNEKGGDLVLSREPQKVIAARTPEIFDEIITLIS